MLLNIVLFARSHLLIMLLRKRQWSLALYYNQKNTVTLFTPIGRSHKLLPQSLATAPKTAEERGAKQTVACGSGANFRSIYFPSAIGRMRHLGSFLRCLTHSHQTVCCYRSHQSSHFQGCLGQLLPTCRNIISPILPGLHYHSLFCALLLGPYCCVG